MKLTDKRFWITWIVVELLMLSSCVYMAIYSKFIGIMCVFGASQPLMLALTLYKKKHQSGALTNLIIVGLYSIYSVYIRTGCQWLGLGILHDCFSNNTAYTSFVVLGYSKNC